MLEELKKAKKFIFIEYFIINNGTMWQEILDILKEENIKATFLLGQILLLSK